MSVKELTRMMVSGKKAEVLKYLRSVPPDVSTEIRKKLLYSIDQVQKKATEIRKTRKPKPKSPSGESKSSLREFHSSNDIVS